MVILKEEPDLNKHFSTSLVSFLDQNIPATPNNRTIIGSARNSGVKSTLRD